ncbi:MAG: hypothetical protein KIT47_19975 [Rhodoferax sp.]|nr:hypothetical protein [Rhodoferax sp.]
MNEIVAAVVGGFLAAGTGWFLQSRLESSRLKRLKQMMVVGITDDLKSSSDLFDRVLDEWDKTQIVWFTTLSELRESRQTYLKNRDWLVLVNDEALRQRVFKYYHRSADHFNLLENQQRRKYEIQNKLNELIRDIQLRDASLTREAAMMQGISLMQAEDQELVGINNMLPQNIQRTRDFKAEAKELLLSLGKKGDV